MDWKLFGTTFFAIFLAEMGDKTQLAAFGLAGSSNRPWIIFIAASLALVSVTALGVAVGSFISREIPPQLIKKSAAVLFVAIGIITWFKA